MSAYNISNKIIVSYNLSVPSLPRLF
jgi:hypothetical protein